MNGAARLTLGELRRPPALAERLGLDGGITAKLAACASCLGSPAATPVLAFTVPGRIEVLGKHTDYAGGRSLTCAVERGFAAVGVARPDNLLRLTDAVSAQRTEMPLRADLPPEPGCWTQYARSVAARFAAAFGPGLCGLDLAFASDLPPAAGLSSGSALLITVALALAARNRLAERPGFAVALPDTEALAAFLSAVEGGAELGPLANRVTGSSGGTPSEAVEGGTQLPVPAGGATGAGGTPSKTVEGGDRLPTLAGGATGGVGTLSGSEDHVAILGARPGQLGLYRYAPIALERRVPMPAGHLFAVAVSGVLAEKSGAARERYNRLAREAARAAELWRRATGRPDRHLGAVFASSPTAAAELERVLTAAARRNRADAGLPGRARQLFAESEEIVPAAAEALASGDLATFGELADRSQRLAEEHLGNQVEETVFLARAAREAGAAAASAFGAGFGGSVWALVPVDGAADFLATWGECYRRRFPAHTERSRFFLTAAGPGAPPPTWTSTTPPPGAPRSSSPNARWPSAAGRSTSPTSPVGCGRRGRRWCWAPCRKAGSSMKSSKRPELLDLERDLPTTAEDVQVLRELRLRRTQGGWEDLLLQLSAAEPTSSDELRKRKTMAGMEPFEL